MLVTQLPAGAQTWIACGFDNAWAVTEYLMADMIDVLQVANWQRSGDNKARKPDRVKRPSMVREDDMRAERMDAKARAFLERQKRREAQSETTEET